MQSLFIFSIVASTIAFAQRCTLEDTSSCVRGDVALYNPQTSGDTIQGLLLTWYNGNWGTVCDDVTDCDCSAGGCTSSCSNGAVNAAGGVNLARVVCTSLRRSGGEEYNANGESSGYDIVVDGTANHITGCNGDESHLAHCSWLQFGSHNCGHSEDVGVICGAEIPAGDEYAVGDLAVESCPEGFNPILGSDDPTGATCKAAAQALGIWSGYSGSRTDHLNTETGVWVTDTGNVFQSDGRQLCYELEPSYAQSTDNPIIRNDVSHGGYARWICSKTSAYYTYNDPVISNGFYCGHGASGAVAGYRLLRTFNGNEDQCKVECGNDVECMVFTTPISNVDYECRGSSSGTGPCCMLIYVDNAPREAPSNAICPNSAGGYARAANSYRLWTKKTQGTSSAPTDMPTQAPTDEPSAQPTDEPTAQPTRAPTSNPTLHPSSSPSLNPTTTQPSQSPTMYSDGILLENGCPSDYPQRYPGTNRCFGYVWGNFGCNIDPKHDPTAHHAGDRRCVYSDFVYVKTSHSSVPEWMRHYLTDTIQRKVAQYTYEYVRCTKSDGSYEDFYTFVNEAQRQSFEGNNDWFIQFPGMKDMWDASGVVESSSIEIHRDEYMPNYQSCTKVVPLGGTRTGNGCPSRIPLRYPGTDRCFETMWKGEWCNVNANQNADPVCQYEEDRHLGATIVDYFTNVQCD